MYGNLRWQGIANQTAIFIQKKMMEATDTLASYVDVFRTQPDSENQGWRGEFWGKTIRGCVLVYEYTKDRSFYDMITASVKDMLTVAEQDGRVSTYVREAEFDSWDIWSRKYVMLALEYYLDICEDDNLRKTIIDFICGCADYIVEHIGNEPKKEITDASRSWLGLNSSSVLEPIVRLYKITKEQKYLDFATYIIENGGAKGINIFELAYENKLYPYQYGVSKAYEMMSCFEGLLEYYYVTGNEKYKTAVVNFGRSIMETELSVIGSCGVFSEVFEHTRTRQTTRHEDNGQETCVTVTWMKLCARIWELTGDSAFLDCVEQAFYNAYLGALNIEENICEYAYEKFIQRWKLPRIEDTYLMFDSYSPLVPGRRGRKIAGNQLLENLTYHGCCDCIGAAGVGMFLKTAIKTDDEGIILNFFEEGTISLDYKGTKVNIDIHTLYPTSGNIQILVKTDKPIEFKLKIRRPGWVNGESGYLIYEKEWFEDEVQINWDMPLRVCVPEAWDEDVVYTDLSQNTSQFHSALAKTVYHRSDDDHYIAIQRGPLTLAADSRTGKDADSVFDFELDGKVCSEKEIIEGVPCMIKMMFTDKEEKEIYLVDYSSAGRDWKTKIAAWLPTK